jgi:transcriptional regulator GlxA family with amidase domain
MREPEKTSRIAPATQSVGFLLLPDFALMSYAAAVEPLRAANQLTGKPLYRWCNAAAGDKPAIASSGAAVLPDLAFGSEATGLDLMLVCAGGNPRAFNDRKTFAWLRRLARGGMTIGGISGGPVIIAKAGLLSGRRCTVHWEHAPGFEEEFPDVTLTRSLFEIDGNRITCSGGIAAFDMMIALIMRDHGYELAAAVSDWFLHTHVREGVGPQRMDLRFRLGVANEKLLAALKVMESNLEKPLAREDLARLAGLSVRQLERIFRAQLSRGIHEHYLSLRLNRARQLLRETSLSVLDVAMTMGFASASQFSRSFRAAFDHSPRDTATRARHRAGT